MQAATIGEALIGFGQNSSFIAAGVSNTTLKSTSGRVCRIVVTVAGTASFTVYDNTTGSGNAIFVSPTTTNLGQIIDLMFPCSVGITIVGVAGSPAIAVSWD